MRVTCHRARAVTRRHPRGIAATQAKRFTSSVAGVASAPHFPPDVSPASSNGQVPYGLEMDRLATRIYCGVAAFEREHALNCEKKECKVPVDSAVRHSICFAIDRWIRCSVVCCGFIHQSNDIHFSSCPTSAMEGLPKYIVLPHVAVHTNVLSHSSTMQGRDTIPGESFVSAAIRRLTAAYSRDNGDIMSVDLSRLTYEGCSAVKLTEEQQTFVNSTTFYIDLPAVLRQFVCESSRPDIKPKVSSHPDDPQAVTKEGIRATNREDIILLSRGKSSRTKSNPAPVPIRHEGLQPAEGKAKIGPIYYMETSDTTHEYHRPTAAPGTDIVCSHGFYLNANANTESTRAFDVLQ
ncbi:hypothetical protein ALC60_00912 [Trachymyrmex zeteki]|uniref:Uncharacterized protein n=1 Tax=Mycetomoellerius zeteki TaxID=64791 RepID=A0A151XIH4_9HYME|nr:hypothetical protein ALC60_00912 [Trachymyrmex zeteki]